MNCEKLRDLLNSDDAALGASARDHMESCPACRDIYAAHLELASTFAALDGPAPSDSFTDTVMARIAAHAETPAPTPAYPAKADRTAWLAALLGAGAAIGATISLILSGAWMGSITAPGFTAASFMPPLISDRLSSLADLSRLGAEGTTLGAGVTLVTMALLRLAASRKTQRD